MTVRCRPSPVLSFSRGALVVASLCCLGTTSALASRRRALPRTTSLVARRHSWRPVAAHARCGRRRQRHAYWSCAVRGGASDDDDDDEDDDEEELDDDVFDDDDEDDEEAPSEADFEGETLKARAVKAWRSTPPMTQVYVGASLALTALVFLLEANVWPDALHFEWRPTLLRLQLWRPLTAFLFYGPFGVSYLLTIHFVWTYMSTLEKLAHAEPWEFAVMLTFGAALLLAGVALAGLNPKFLAHNLSCFLVYIWARTYEGQEVNVMEFFNIKAELLPWFFVAQTYLLEHELPVHDLLGIAIGHLYVWMRQRDILKAPPRLVALFESRPALMAKYAAMADEFGEKDDEPDTTTTTSS